MNANDPGVWKSTDAILLSHWVHGILILYLVMLRTGRGLSDIPQKIMLNCVDKASKSSNSET